MSYWIFWARSWLIYHTRSCGNGCKSCQTARCTRQKFMGSDQSASIEPVGLNKLIRDIKAFEQALGEMEKRKFMIQKNLFWRN